MWPEILSYLELLSRSLFSTLRDILPILLVLGFFQIFVIKKNIPHLGKIIWGLALVVVGLAIFILGLEKCIFPVGTEMASQLANLNSIETVSEVNNPDLGAFHSLKQYFWIIFFAFCIGFSTTLAEPSLIAVALKAEEISTGAISPWGLRIAVALGVAFGVSLGTYRIVEGTPLAYYIIGGYIFLIIQTQFAPSMIVPLAYDSGGVTTSTVTVPLVVALGIGLASNIPGRSPLTDGFGLIAFASLFPIISVLGYAKAIEWMGRKSNLKDMND